MTRKFKRYITTVFAIAMVGTVACSTPAAPTHKAEPASQQQPMNVLFIMADDLAPVLGDSRYAVLTPNLDRLAAQGVSFDRAYSQFPWCAPSRASLLTGIRPSGTGVMDLQTHFRTALPDIQTLPQYFRNNGYFSGRVGKIYHQGVPGGIGLPGPDDPDSWDQVIDPRGRDRDAEGTTLKVLTPGIPYGGAMAYLEDEGTDEEQTDGMVASEAIEMMRANRDKPFFIGIGFYRPHVPEIAPRHYFDQYRIEDIPFPEQSEEVLDRTLPATRSWTPYHMGMTPDEQRTMIWAYYAATTFMDAQVGRVLDALDELGLAENTIVVFTSDHGFLLGEHGQWAKNLLWDASARVPLVIRAPGMHAAGRRSDRTVELLDLYPTIVELAGLPPYERNEGTSLQPLLDRPDDPEWVKPAFSQVAGGRGVWTQQYRYTEWEEGREGRELYDHHSDPNEMNNLVDTPRYASLVAELRALLPADPVEARPAPAAYDRIRECLLSMSGNRGQQRQDGSAAAAAPRNLPAGLQLCDMLDP